MVASNADLSIGVVMPMNRRQYRLSVDIGGTFTDIALLDSETGLFWPGKTLTTPHDPSEAVLTGVTETLAQAGVAPEQIGQFFHATTLATNALIERKGVRTALITTRGFRDVLEMRDEGRYDLFDLGIELPAPLVPRELRFEVDERVLSDGSVRTPLNDASVAVAAEAIREAAVDAIAVSLIHSYQNPDHEKQIRDQLGKHLGDIHVSISAEVAPEIREYQRTSTTVANAYIQPLIERYLERLQARIRDLGIRAEILMMLSSGGACTLDAAKRFPVRLVESGPAAGVILAGAAGQVLQRPSMSSFDMGGTTAKSCLIVDGQPRMAPEFETARVWRFKKGSGLPLRTPVIELIEIGAGGGSIASIDALGILNIGPHSAGAQPGPACYGRGGALPTVTDADLVLGYLDPHHFLGGTMTLDRGAAEAAIKREIGAPLGLDLMRAAWAIHAKVNETMAAAARMAAVERGGDPSVYPLFAFGGAGPVHAYGVGKTLRVPEVIVGVGAGIGSALGLLAAPVAFDFVRSHPAELASLNWTEVAELSRSMTEEGRALVQRAGIADELTEVRISADLRYQGQGYEIEVDYPDAVGTLASSAELLRRFEKGYRQRYGHTLDGVSVEIVNWRCRVSGPMSPLANLTPAGTTTCDADAEPSYSRSAYFDDIGIKHDTPVYPRALLSPGAILHGPCIVEEAESTTVVGTEATVSVHDSGVLVLTMRNRKGAL
jgi:N-methylhydantoinase A